MDKEVEEAVEKLSIILEEVNNLMDAVKHDINLLSLSVDELETIFQKDEDFGPTGAYVNQDPDLKK